MSGPRRVRIGITVTTFVADPGVPLEISRAAEDAGLDGVFVFDHLYGLGSQQQRPALECTSLMGAIAATTRKIAIGSLVARVTIRPAASLVAALATVSRISTDSEGNNRLIAGLGTGDEATNDEDLSFGVTTKLTGPATEERLDLLRTNVAATRRAGLRTWVGGSSAQVRDIASSQADGWNQWGGTALGFSERTAQMQSQIAARNALGKFEFSWGGLVLLGESNADAHAKGDALGVTANREITASGPKYLVGGPDKVAESLAEFVGAGADWIILAPVDSVNLENVALIAERIKPLLV